MRPGAVAAALCAVAVLLGPLGLPLAAGGTGPGAEAPTEGDGEHVPVTDDLAVYPGPDVWLRDPKPTLSILVLNDSFTPVLEQSRLFVDGGRIAMTWDPDAHLAEGIPDFAFPDGVRDVTVLLEDASGTRLAASWSFGLDTVAPLVTLDSLPETADRRVFDVGGVVDEANLAEVRVNGFPAILDGSRFMVPVVLWPGRNELWVTALDRAGNPGYGLGRLGWFPPRVENASYTPFAHPTARFLTRFPSAWEVELDVDLDGGLRAQAVATEPPIAPLRGSIAIVSRPVGEAMTEDLLLSILEDSIQRVGAQAKLTVVSRPQPVAAPPGTVAAEFSVVESLSEGPRVFRLVTGYWSRSLSRIWLLIGSMPVDRIDTTWDGVAAATEAFRVVEPEPPTPPGDTPQSAIDRAFVVTVGAILFLVALFVSVLYTLWTRRRRARPGFRT